MRALKLVNSLVGLFTVQCVFADVPVTISDPSPAIASTYTVGDSSVVLYTMTNNVPQATPITVTGLSAPVSRTTVAHDCGNTLPPGPSTCKIGVLIAPTSSNVGKSYNENLTVSYDGRTPLVKNIAFSVIDQLPPETVVISASQPSLVLATDGVPRTVTITTSAAAHDVAYTISPKLPEGTIVTPAICGEISPTQACVLTITPGNLPSTAAGAAPVPSILKVQGTNTNTLSVAVSVATVGNIYQQGYIYHIDDTTPVTGSIGGSIVSLKDSVTGIQWYNGDAMITGANSLTDGAANTTAIDAAQGAGNYAASYCAKYEIDSAGNTPCVTGNTCYNHWYLPAVCEMGPATSDSGCPAGTPNIFESLVKDGIGEFSQVNNYWSSTEYPINPNSFAWYEFYGAGHGVETSFHAAGNKYMDLFYVRCNRVISR